MDEKKEVPPSQWGEDEQKDWNVLLNVFGWTLIAYCASRSFAQAQRFGMPDKYVIVGEALFLLFVLYTGLWTVFARHKRTREQLPYMCTSKRVFYVGMLIAAMELIFLVLAGIRAFA